MSENAENYLEFQKSVTQEFEIVKDRVRNLIGSANWGEEGRYKEAILKNVIRRFLPNNFSLGTGFIISNNGKNRSKQIDIIVYDNTYPLLFKEGEFIITTPKNVKGIIEVKSKIGTGSNTFEAVVKQFNNSLKGIIKTNKLFLGLFSYDFEGNTETESFNKVLKQSKSPNHVSLGKDIFIKKWDKKYGERLKPPVDNPSSDFYNVYKIENLSYSYFISNLLSSLVKGIDKDRYWFLYPIIGTKERHKIKTIFIR